MSDRRMAKLRSRRLPIEKQASVLAEAYEMTSEKGATKYLIGAMQSIDVEYTENTIGEADRVKENLRSGLDRMGLAPDFRYQGSVTSDTHIKVYSDIDLLVLDNRFFSLEPPQIAEFPYHGNPLDDLAELRAESTDIVANRFPQVDIDNGDKSIALTGGSLSRKVDVVIGNWWDTNDYARTGNPVHRGVMIFDRSRKARVKNKPFLHNELLNQKDLRTNGGLRKVIRLLKSVRYDADQEVDLSSYDIAAIAYNTPDSLLNGCKGNEVQLAGQCFSFLSYLLASPNERNKLNVPNGMRSVFCDEGASEGGLRSLTRELGSLLLDIKSELEKTFRTLEAAKVSY